MSTQIRNDDLINLLRGDVQMRYEQAFHWSQAISTYLALPGLRGFWPMSSVAYTNPQGLDESGNVNHLTNNNVSTFGYTNLIPHVTFNGTTQSLSKPDGGAAQWADVTGLETYIDSGDRGLTFGGWFQFGRLATGEFLIAKYVGLAGQRSYYLSHQVDDSIAVVVSVDGTAITAQSTAANTITSTSLWYHIIGRFDPSTELAVFVNGQKTPNVVAIPASIFDSPSAFYIGAQSNATSFFQGKTSMCFLCAAQLSDSIITALFNQTRAMFNV